MKFSGVNGRDMIDRIYLNILLLFSKVYLQLAPYARRIVRFVALPYCYFVLIDWSACSASRIQVARDLLYIFFKLKYFPDNYFECKLWEVPRGEWKYYYGSTYDPYQRRQLRKFVQPENYQVIYEDKWVFSLVCKLSEIASPKSLCVIPKGSEIKEFLISSLTHNDLLGKLILKPVSGKGGHNIIVVKVRDGEIYIYEYGAWIRVGRLSVSESYIVQNYIEQDLRISRFSKSVNTVRIVTLLTKSGCVVVLGAYIRFGVRGSLIDNYSKGGVKVKIDIDKGVMSGAAKDRKGGVYSLHPDSGVKFDGYAVPYWDEVLKMAAEFQKAVCFHRLLGFDIALGESGPVLIEANSIYDNVGLEGVCGPILKNEDVLTAFSEYDLLINKSQKSLLKNY